MQRTTLVLCVSVCLGLGMVLVGGCENRTAGGGGGDGDDRCAGVECADGEQCNSETGVCEPIQDGGNGGGNGVEGLAAGLVEVPDPLSEDNPVYPLQAAATPGPGDSVTDARLGTVQTRVTQAEQRRHEYARYDPFNADQSMIILHDVMEGDFVAYRTDTVPYDDAGNRVTTLDL